MKKKSPGENVERKRDRTIIAEAEPLRTRIAAWAETIDEPLARFDLAALEELPDRAMDIWEPLLGIARNRSASPRRTNVSTASPSG